MRPWRTGADALRDRLAAERAPAARAVGPTDARAGGEPPPHVAQRLAEWHLLHDVPFAYLVPDARLAPPESLRFFHLDGAWTDALAEGALAAGGLLTGDDGLPDAVRAARDRAIAGVRDRRHGRTDAAAEPVSGPVTGLLLRSAAVSRWPTMRVRAYRGSIPPDIEPDDAPDGERLPLLRLERVAPSVLVALFAGRPTLVVLEEPHDNVVLGVAAAAAGGWTLALRAADGGLLEDDGDAARIEVPLRPGAEELGVVDVSGLRSALGAEARRRPEMPRPVSPAVLALQLLRAPWRQRFGAPGNR